MVNGQCSCLFSKKAIGNILRLRSGGHYRLGVMVSGVEPCESAMVNALFVLLLPDL